MLRSWSGLLLIAVVVKEAGSKDLPLLSLGRCFEAELYCWSTTALYRSCRHRCRCPVSHLLYSNSNLTPASNPNPDPHLLLCIPAPASEALAYAQSTIAPPLTAHPALQGARSLLLLGFFSFPSWLESCQWKRTWGHWSTARGI